MSYLMILFFILTITTFGGMVASYVYAGNDKKAEKFEKWTNISWSALSYVIMLTLIAAVLKAADIL